MKILRDFFKKAALFEVSAFLLFHCLDRRGEKMLLFFQEFTFSI